MLPLFVLCLVLFYTFQSLFTRLYNINYAPSDRSMTTSVFAICFGGFIGLSTLIANGFSFTPAWQTVLWGVANAFMLWLYNVSMIKAGDRGSYAFMMVTAVVGAIVVPLVVDALFMGETVTALQGAAIALMLCSFVVMNARGMSLETLRGASGGYYMWCGLLFMANGLYATIMNVQQGTMGSEQSPEMIVITYLGMALIVVALECFRGGAKKLAAGFAMGKKSALFVLGCVIVATLASNLLLYTLSLMNASILYTIENGGVLVLSAIFSCIFFREKLHWEQMVGIGMAVASIVMISL